MPSVNISAFVITLNEEHNIEYCLRSVRPWCDEVIVVDLESDDRTREIAERYADVFVRHERIADFGLARQAGLDHATGDWILSIDADEVVTPGLARWIREFIESDPDYDVARIPRINVFLGRRLRSTPWWPGKPRLFRRGGVAITPELHSGIKPVPGARVAVLPRSSAISLWHFTRVSLESVAEKWNRYTTIEARRAIENGQGDPRMFELFSDALRELVVYVVKRGYRDGIGGLAYAMSRSYAKFLLAAKRWDQPRSGLRQARYDALREHILRGFGDDGRPLTPREAVMRTIGEETRA